MSQEIIRYHRKENNRPTGVVVVLRDNNGDVKFGWSSCQKGDVFDKEIALDIARARAMKGNNRPIPTDISDVVRYNGFMERCESYFKETGLSVNIFTTVCDRKLTYEVTTAGLLFLENYPTDHLPKPKTEELEPA
jgi:hypothetical protein